jgi:Na+(H+)/acetate symporter ActP
MDNPALATAAKWVGAAVFVVVAAIVIYLGAVLSVYVIAWVVELIGIIFD